MNKNISVLKLTLTVTISILVLLIGAASLLAFQNLTLVINRGKDRIYLEKSINIASLLDAKNNRLLRTGLPEAYKEDFQKQILKQIHQVYGSTESTIPPIIIDETGYIYYPFENKPNFDSTFLQKIFNKKNVSFNFKVNNINKWFYSHYFSPWKWYIIHSVPINEKYLDRRMFFYLFIPMILFLSTLLITLTFFIMKTIMKPVADLTKASAAIAKGDLSVKVKLDGIGELGELSENFTFMRNAISQQLLELKNRENNLKITLNSIGDAILVTDSEGIIKRSNTASSKLLKKETAEILDFNIEMILNIEQLSEDRSVTIDTIIKKGKPYTFAPNCKIITNQNKQIPISGNAAPLINENKEITGMVIAFRDISKELKLREDLQQSQKMDAVGQLAGGIAHDFNNMLAGIINAAEMAEDSNENEKKEYIEIILNAAKRAANLTKQLLSFSRKGKKTNKIISVNNVVLETISLLKRTINKSIQIKHNLSATSFFISGDSTVLQNALVNMGINAGHAMPEGGTLTFSTSNTSLDKEYCNASSFEIMPGEYIDIMIEDTGHGIPPETINRIFEPFFTTKNQGEGTGLGLSAVYGMIQEHNGEITVTSIKGKVTTFHIFLPLTKAESQNNNSVPNSTSYGSGTILIVDDEEIIRKTADKLIGSLGYNTITAINGKEALEIFKEREQEIDLIILDMIMPVMDGKETFERIREINNDVPIVISSGYAQDNDIIEMKKRNIAAFMNKPFSKATLSNIIKKAINKRS